jgi:hypothetical protein
MHKDITVVLVSSVLPSHPDTSIIEETIDSIKYHLPDSEIILQIDGLREEQLDRYEDYNDYKSKMLWKCLHKYDNILPLIFDEHSHQSTMMRATFEYIKTPLVLYVEADCPLVTDLKIDWDKCKEMIYTGEANTIRYHFEAQIPKEHNHMMLGIEGDFMKTVQWSQRPHLSSVLYYKDVVMPRIPEKSFIEDTFHGVVHSDYLDNGKIGWYKHRLYIYYPKLGKNIKRSYHLDGREGTLKFTTDDEVWQ